MSLDLDPDALGALYREHAKSLLVHFSRRCYDPQQALDLVGETFARAHAARGRFRGESWEEAEAWLWGIARHVLADALRRGRAERRALDRLGVEPPRLADDELARVEQLAGLIDLKDALAGALQQLSPAQREALRLRVVLELDYPAVAARLGVSQQVARARVSRALRSLSVVLDSVEGRS
jgi:RNA polymerase sigma-70 factor (ECF subfamily)